MKAMHSLTSRIAPVPKSLLLAGAAAVFLLVTCTFGYLILDSRSQLRGESEKRFQTRAVISAAMTDSLFATASGQQQQAAAKAFGGRIVDGRALAASARESRSEYALVLDAKGKVLAASGDVRRRAPSDSPHIRAALAGRAHLSGVLPTVKSGDPRLIEWALPFKTRFGPRVEVVALRTDAISGFLGRYLIRGRESANMNAYVVDDAGAVLASTGKAGRLPKGLSGALGARHGKYREGGTDRYFASAPVTGSSWRTVVSEPTRDLYPLLATGRTWLLWGVLAAFAATAAASLLLFRRVLRTAEQLTGANAGLEARQAELRLANEQLENQTRLAQEASRAKSAFLANMSHELRTPLNAIIGFSELMINGNGMDDGERREYLGHVIASGRHLEQLVNDILDLSKVEAGKMEFHPQPVDLPGLVADVTGTMQVLVERKRLQMDVHVAPDVQSAIVDPARLKQVLYNYLSNAVKFTPEGGFITIRVDPAGRDHFRLAVEDTGIGIAPEGQAKLFEEFEQLDQTVGKEHQGTGLGLALVKRLVEAQGGEVGVESERGKGSVFSAVLPRTPQDTGTVSGRALDGALRATVPAVQAAGSPTVLVVEDDRQDQALLEDLLVSRGYVVEIAGTGAEAVAKSRERHFDATVLDLMLPDMSGFDVLRTIRVEGKNRATRAIVVTMVKETGLAKAFAVNEWLVKPVNGDQLLSALERAGIQPECGTVLVVDDDPASMRLAAATIERLGCRVVCAGGGAEGLEAAAANGPLSAIVLDLLMPDVDGFQFLERLRSTPDGGQTPVIVWTSRDLSVAEQATLLQTAQGLVGKSQRNMRLADELKPFLAELDGAGLELGAASWTT